MKLLQKIQDFILGGYEADKTRDTNRIVSRLKRGNTNSQNNEGEGIDQARLDAMSRKADATIARHDKMFLSEAP